MKEYKDKILKEGLRLREFNSNKLTDESTWHRDAGDRLVEVLQGHGWKLQVDNRMPILMKEGDIYKIPAKMWHRIIPGNGELSVLIREIAMRADYFKNEEEEVLDIAGLDAIEFAEEMGEDFGGPISLGMDHNMLPNLRMENSKPHMKGYKAPEGSARDKKLDAASAAYKRGDLDTAIRIRDEMEKKARDAPGFKTRKSKYTDESKQPAVYPPVMSELSEAELDEKLGASTREALKKKAESHNAPLGALSTVYKKGLGAFYSSGSRPGMGPQQWAMARVNSFLKGGKARQVDAAQWKQVQDFRKK